MALAEALAAIGEGLIRVAAVLAGVSAPAAKEPDEDAPKCQHEGADWAEFIDGSKVWICGECPEATK